MQRLDPLRKYGFGSLCVFGTEPKNEIGSCWLLRGPEIPEEMTAAEDTEFYKWRKLDHTNSVDKQLIKDYFAWSSKIDGKSFKQGKNFK